MRISYYGFANYQADRRFPPSSFSHCVDLINRPYRGDGAKGYEEAVFET